MHVLILVPLFIGYGQLQAAWMNISKINRIDNKINIAVDC